MTTVDWRTWVPERLAYPEVPVGALLDGAARRYGDRVAFRHHDRTLTFTGLWRAASGFAHHLHARGVVPGDVVGVHLPNVLAFPVAYYGILLAGATFTPVSPQLPPDGVAAQLADAGAVAVVGLADVGAGVPLIATDGVGFEGVADAEAPPVVDVDPTVARAHLAYTGGTTGSPKGVVLTHANVVTNVLQYACHGSGSRPVPGVGGEVGLEQIGPAQEWPIRLGEGIGIAVAPWFHAMGTIGGIGVAVASGATSIVHERFDPARFLADVETHRATTISGAPPLFHALLAHPEAAQRDLTSVRTVTSGAAPMPLALARRIAERMPEAVIVEGYGMTEATMGLTHRRRPRGRRTAGSARSASRCRTPRSASARRTRPPGWARPARCGRAVRRSWPATSTGRRPPRRRWSTGGCGPATSACSARTGSSRSSTGPRTCCSTRATTCTRASSRSCSRPAPRSRRPPSWDVPDAAVGEEPVAVIVPAPGHEPTPELGAALAAALDEQVAPYKRLRAVHVVDALPVSAAGKVLKRDLRDALTGGSTPLGGPIWTRATG